MNAGRWRLRRKPRSELGFWLCHSPAVWSWGPQSLLITVWVLLNMPVENFLKIPFKSKFLFPIYYPIISKYLLNEQIHQWAIKTNMIFRDKFCTLGTYLNGCPHRSDWIPLQIKCSFQISPPKTQHFVNKTRSIY